MILSRTDRLGREMCYNHSYPILCSPHFPEIAMRFVASCFLLLFVLSLGAVPALAEKDVDGLEELIPHAPGTLEIERYQAPGYPLPRLDFSREAPLGPIRNCAEWEPTTGVMIRYPLGLPYDLLRDMDDQVTLHVVVSSGYLSTAQSNLAASGVDMDKVQFLVRNNDSIWTRDYGPWFIFDGNGELGIVNHTYNRPYRPNDNLIPLYFGQENGIPVYSHSMYHTGGNYMTDGAHISASTRLVYDEAASENGMTQAEVDALMQQYYGIENYAVLDYIEFGGIHHIDTWAKFLDEETVLVKEVWPGHHTHDTLEQRATLLASLTASTGRPYQVHRVYCFNSSGGDPAAYTNSLILNNHIYVPLFGNSTHDANALEAYRAAAPGYEVSGYLYNGFLSDDALHCRTKGIMDGGMLRVGHIPLREETQGDATIEARFTAYSGADITYAVVYYKHAGGYWMTTDMNPAADGTWQATIPAPEEATTCEYYIHVSDASGRSAGMPRSEPAASYSFAHLPASSSAVGQVVPAAATLDANYPNPFNPSTSFRFELKFAGEAELVILDMRGRQVRTLARGTHGPGEHVLHWDGTDDAGRALPSGVYLYRLRAAGLQYTRAATLVK
ncbi:hypothetical protein CSB20_08290 [bacterium DOLZORAL124_64_63]|nr:MAG: hypothetical protein CSB20_08290 [bacterium DOLZORAL124_64_63]